MKKKVLNKETERVLMDAARRARERAYAPYSGFKVGAAVLTPEGHVFAACNVENASYGLCLCAERAAVAKAVSEGHRAIVAVAVAADSPKPVPPCGACRQAISELGPDALVLSGSLRGAWTRANIAALLPHSFGPAHLKKRAR